MGNKKQLARVTVLIAILCVFAAPGVGQGSGPVIDSVTRGNWNALSGEPAAADTQQSTFYRVEMPDGILLATQLWLPTTGGPTFPTAFTRTPYGRFRGSDERSLYLQNEYAVVGQDVRGFGLSQGSWYFWEDEPSDGHATIEWITQQMVQRQGGDGRPVGTWGRRSTPSPRRTGGAQVPGPGPREPRSVPPRAWFPVASLFYGLVLQLAEHHGLLPPVSPSGLEHRLWDSWWDGLQLGRAAGGRFTCQCSTWAGGTTWRSAAPSMRSAVVQHQGGAGAAGNQYLLDGPAGLTSTTSAASRSAEPDPTSRLPRSSSSSTGSTTG